MKFSELNHLDVVSIIIKGRRVSPLLSELKKLVIPKYF